MAQTLRSVSILIPCYNEERRIGATVEAVVDYVRRSELDAELILVDDGSTDRTGEIMEACRELAPFVRAIRTHPNRGKGAALRRGVEAAEKEAVLFFDADLSYPLSSVEGALEALGSSADLVVGARDLHPEGFRRTYSPVRSVSSFAFNLLVDRYLGLRIPDTQCGFKAFRLEVARTLFSHLTVERFGFDVELLYLAKRWGYQIHRLPVRMTHQVGSSVRVLRDGWQMWRDVRRVRRNAKRGLYPASP